MSNTRKILPVRYPSITSWQWHATLFSILGDDENAKKWIYSNYIQLRCYTINEIFTGDDILFADVIPGRSSLRDCPYLITSLLTDRQIESYCGNVIDFIIKTIDLNGYIYGVFDEAQIISPVDMGYKFPHELFIYGYDIEKEIFYVGDFTFTDKYSYSEVSFKDIERGYNVISASEDHMFKDDYKGTRGLYVIQKNDDNTYYEVDRHLIKRTMEEYLASKDTKTHFRMVRNHYSNTTYGISVYDRVLTQVNDQINKEEPDYDIRALHILYDHKVLMLERIKYLMANEYIALDQSMVEDYERVVDDVLAARNLMLRISITGEFEAAERFEGYLNEAKELETKVLTKIVETI